MYIPPHLSEKAREQLKLLEQATAFETPRPEDTTTWEAIREALNDEGARDLEILGIEHTLKDTSINDVPCVWMETPNINTKNKVLLYIHGGVFCFSNPKSAAVVPLQIANESGIKILAVNYRKAPEHPYPAGLDDVINVYQGLLEQGYSAKHIAWFGDSAGGGLVTAGIMRLKDGKIPLPAAIGLLYPWVDLAGTGDSFFTLADNDPVLFNWAFLSGFAKVYCRDQDPYHPYVSPVYGDFKNFPPIHIQVGSKEILLSDAIRIYQKAKEAETRIILNVYDGMWHGFHYSSHVPEAKKACKEMALFLRQSLVKN